MSPSKPPVPGSVFFPLRPRFFRGQRWVNIALRSAHLVGMAGIGGGFLFSLDSALWESYWLLTLGTGIALSLLYLWSTLAWVLELKGLAVVLKTALLALAFAIPDARTELFIVVVVLSSLIAHAPARVRNYRWSQLLSPHKRRGLP